MRKYQEHVLRIEQSVPLGAHWIGECSFSTQKWIFGRGKWTMCLFVGRLVTPLLIVSINQVIDCRTVANENMILSFDISVQICTVIRYVEIHFSSIKHRLQFSRLIILDEPKKRNRENIIKHAITETIVAERHAQSHTLVMAYSMQLPRCAPKFLSLLMRSSIFLMGNVNFDRVKNAVKLAV